MKRCSSEIKKYVASLPPGKLFTTTQVLLFTSNYSSRNTIDQALARLVKRGTLERLTSGIFVESENRKTHYTSLEIIDVKSKDRDKATEFRSYKDANNQPISPRNRQSPRNNFCSIGNSTRFRYEEGYITTKQMSARKLKLASSDVGALILYLWQNGNDKTDVTEIANSIASLSRIELEEFIGFTPCMPYWLLTKAKRAIGPKWQKIEKELQKRDTAKEPKGEGDSIY